MEGFGNIQFPRWWVLRKAKAQYMMKREKKYGGQSFWARGYYVSTVGRDEKTIRTYINEQEKEDEKLEQCDLFRQKR